MPARGRTYQRGEVFDLQIARRAYSGVWCRKSWQYVSHAGAEALRNAVNEQRILAYRAQLTREKA
jgi:hypothetical protein